MYKCTCTLALLSTCANTYVACLFAAASVSKASHCTRVVQCAQILIGPLLDYKYHSRLSTHDYIFEEGSEVSVFTLKD